MLHLESKFINFNLKGIFLGDLICTLYLLENLGRQKKIKSNITVDVRYQEISDIFVFKYVNLVYKSNFTWQSPKNFKKFLVPCKKQHQVHFTNGLLNLINSYGYKNYLSDKLDSSIQHNTESVVCVQFDSRTAVKMNTDMSIETKLFHVNNIKDNIEVIGGIETPKYLGDSYNYQLGDLKFLAKKVLSCKYFFGCDSGMSHLAGALGKITKIFIYACYCHSCIVDVYSNYRNFILL